MNQHGRLLASGVGIATTDIIAVTYVPPEQGAQCYTIHAARDSPDDDIRKSDLLVVCPAVIAEPGALIIDIHSDGSTRLSRNDHSNSSSGRVMRLIRIV